MKNKSLMIFALLLVFSTSAFAAGAVEAFKATFVAFYADQLANLMIIGVALFSLYEFWKTKQFTFLIIGAVVAILVIAIPSMSQTASTTWKQNFEAKLIDANATTNTW